MALMSMGQVQIPVPSLLLGQVMHQVHTLLPAALSPLVERIPALHAQVNIVIQAALAPLVESVFGLALRLEVLERTAQPCRFE